MNNFFKKSKHCVETPQKNVLFLLEVDILWKYVVTDGDQQLLTALFQAWMT